MKINTTRFGEVAIDEDKVFTFRHGLPGFPAEKSFALLPYQPDGPFSFLQSTKDPDLTFLVVDPFIYFPDYEFDLDDTVASELALTADAPPSIVNIVTVPKKIDDMTANLLAPIIINEKTKQAVQLVLENTGYSTRHHLFTEKSADKGAK